jgi:hypothetical protein
MTGNEVDRVEANSDCFRIDRYSPTILNRDFPEADFWLGITSVLPVRTKPLAGRTLPRWVMRAGVAFPLRYIVGHKEVPVTHLRKMATNAGPKSRDISPRRSARSDFSLTG